MRRRIVLVIHDYDSFGDRASQHLAARGLSLEWVCPAQGDTLPAPNTDFDAAIVYGGVQSANRHAAPDYVRREIDWAAEWVETQRPYLGLCLGGQILARALGAEVGPHPQGQREYGFVPVFPTEAGRDLMPEPMHVYSAHNEGFECPPGSELLLRGEVFPHHAFRYGSNAYAFQFHPECTPGLMRQWMRFSAGRPLKPGQHNAQRQIEDSLSFDTQMGAWFERFLERWLDGTPDGPSTG